MKTIANGTAKRWILARALAAAAVVLSFNVADAKTKQKAKSKSQTAPSQKTEGTASEKLARTIIEGSYCADGSKVHLNLEAAGYCPQCTNSANTSATGLGKLAKEVTDLKTLAAQGANRARAVEFYRFLKTHPEFRDWLGGTKEETVESLTSRIESAKGRLESLNRKLLEDRARSQHAADAAEAMTKIPESRPSPEQIEVISLVMRPQLREWRDSLENAKQRASMTNHPESVAYYNSLVESRTQALAQLTALQGWLEQTTTEAPNADIVARIQERVKRYAGELTWAVTYTKEDIEHVERRLKDFEARLEKLKTSPTPTPAPDEAIIAEVEERAVRTIRDNISRGKSLLPRCGLTLDELLALTLYTGSYYGSLNKALRQGRAESVKPFTDVLVSALKKIKPYTGTVKRGADLPAEAAKKYSVGAVVTYPGFTSSSVGTGFGGKYNFVIRSKTGRLIAPYSGSYGELEVLFPAGARFKVLSMKTSGVDKREQTEIVMEEVGP